MVNISLKQLRYFESLARHCHFGRAAAACAISQPALSVQIKELEQELGTVLFERGARLGAVDVHLNSIMVAAREMKAVKL
jgi:LysR family hydrogen peroxide-inducible transcriptional activator